MMRLEPIPKVKHGHLGGLTMSADNGLRLM
jgi:hypothetical protein